MIHARINMLEKNELNQILAFISKRWTDLSRDPDNKALKTLPSDFWMNSLGGPAGSNGRWVTTIMYTENEDDANKFKEVVPYISFTSLPMIEISSLLMYDVLNRHITNKV